MEVSLRFANTADLKVINERYAEIDFVPSHDDELIVLASISEKTVGQGRVVG
ncbi:GNAT family N-acetyltransferase, partial [Acinetobacter baumannii]